MAENKVPPLTSFISNRMIAILLCVFFVAVSLIIILQKDPPNRIDYIEVVKGKVVEHATPTTTTESSVDEELPEMTATTSSEETPEEIVEEEVVATSSAPDEENVAPVVVTDPIESHLLAWLAFDDGSGAIAKDNSSNGNHGILLQFDTEVAWVNGVFQKGLLFDGVNDHVAIPHSESLNVGRPNVGYSVAFWFRSADTPTTRKTIIGKGVGAFNTPFDFGITEEGLPSLIIKQGSTTEEVTLGQIITDGTWHHIAFGYDPQAKQMHLYTDKGKKGKVVLVDVEGDLTNAAPILINKATAPGAEHSFVFDDLHIYRKMLSLDEIRLLVDNLANE